MTSLRRLKERGRQATAAVGAASPAADSPRLGLTLLAASMCVFVVQLDFFALNLALPRMATDLGTTTTDLQWVVSGYMLAVAAFFIPGGRIGDILSRRRVLMVGLAVFGLCSLGAGLAPTTGVVIGFRIAQGIGAGILFPLAIAVITDAFPPERTMRAIGNAYGIGAIALAIGPMFGGGLTQLVTWRWVFIVNLPISVATIAVVWVGVRDSRDTTVPRTIDVPGLVLVALGIATVTFAVDRTNAWSGAVVAAIGAAGVLLLAGFVQRERVARWPLVALDLFANTRYVLVTVLAMVANSALVTTVFVVTILLQEAEGYSPFGAGVVFLALSLGVAAGGPLSGRIGDRVDIPWTMAAATVLGGAGLFLVTAADHLGAQVPGLALAGFGYGIGWAMGSVGTQTVVPRERAGQASGVTLTIVVGVAATAVAAAAVLIEVGGNDLSATIDTLLRWTAVGGAVAAVALAAFSTRSASSAAETSG